MDNCVFHLTVVEHNVCTLRYQVFNKRQSGAHVRCVSECVLDQQTAAEFAVDVTCAEPGGPDIGAEQKWFSGPERDNIKIIFQGV